MVTKASMPITPREWRKVLIWAAVLMALTTLPYIACAAASNSEWRFGGSVIGVTDGNSYLAKMRQGARGDWLFHIVYTSEPHEGALLFLPYILLGKLAALFVAPGTPALVGAMVTVFHLARVGFGVLAIAMTYRFAAAYLRSPTARMAATIIITAGGGLGWFMQIAGMGNLFDALPLDFYVPESYTFLILYALPHMALARAALLCGLLLLMPSFPRRASHAHPSGTSRRRSKEQWASVEVRGRSPRQIKALPSVLLAGLCWAVMGLCVPFYVAVLYVILGVWGLGVWARARRFPWELFWRAVGGALVTLPLLLYTGYHFITNEVFAAWSTQNDLPAPHPLHYIFGYGVLAIPAVAGLRWAWRRGRTRDMLLIAWVSAAPVLVYLPITVQRRLAEGVFVPLGILAVAGLRGSVAPWLAKKLHKPRKSAWKIALSTTLLLVLPTSLLLLVGGTALSFVPKEPAFHPTGEVAAMDWLAANTPRGAVVLSSFETGNYLPVRADVIAFLGLGPETVNAAAKQEMVQRFFNGAESAGALQSLYEEYGADYVFYGPQEGADTQPVPAWASDLQAIYNEAGYTIYAVP